MKWIKIDVELPQEDFIKMIKVDGEKNMYS